MNKKIVSAKNSVKKFWNDKKGTIAVIATATTVGMVAINRAHLKTVNHFLEQNDMTEAWQAYLIEEDPENLGN